MQSMKRNDHIRVSLLSSKMFGSPTESLAASLHRGLQIIDHHQRASVSSKSSVALSFEHLALKPCEATNQFAATIPTSTAGKANFLCATCKQEFNGSNEVQDSLIMSIVPFDGSQNSEGLEDRGHKCVCLNQCSGHGYCRGGFCQVYDSLQVDKKEYKSIN